MFLLRIWNGLLYGLYRIGILRVLTILLQAIFFWPTFYWRPWRRQQGRAKKREESWTYHQRLTDLHIVRGFDLIRLMMNQGNSFMNFVTMRCCNNAIIYGFVVCNVSNFVKQYFSLLIYIFFGLNSVLIFCYLKIHRYNSIYAYGQSKLANILHANELTKRLKVSTHIGS